MSDFSEFAMCKHLESLTGATVSIQNVSSWLLCHQKRHSDTIIRIWLAAIKKEIRPSRLLNLFYLANDVIQNSRKLCPEFRDAFYSVLEPALKHMSMYASESAVFAVKEVLSVFHERQIYLPERIDVLMRAMATSLSDTLMAVLTDDTDAMGFNASYQIQMIPRASPHSTSPLSSMVEDSVSVPTTNTAVFVEADTDQMRVIASEMLGKLMRLSDPPSADAATMNRIESFPAIISNPSILKTIKNEVEARELLAMIDKASPFIKDYCERLSTELDWREGLREQLNELCACVKESCSRNDELIGMANETLAKLKEEGIAAVHHLDSLPDVSVFPPVAFVPQSGSGQLFTNLVYDPRFSLNCIQDPTSFQCYDENPPSDSVLK